MAFAACVILGSSSDPAAGGAKTTIEGDLFCLASAFSYAVHNVRLKDYAAKGDTQEITIWSKAAQMVLGAIFLLVAVQLGACPSPAKFLADADTSEVLALVSFALFNGMLVKGVAVLCQANAYRVVQASEAEVALATTPLFALMLATLYLGEPVTGQTIVGAALFTGSLILAAQSPNAQDAQKVTRG
jgi:drug/metabolite transporter (DMT)-like permease